ncbi:MAG: glycine--tRNA ligase subunit beta [Chlamydiota bacterium]
MLTFQQIIQTLMHFWEKQGCILHQGYDLEVGAGTFNPSTFLRSLGKEPYNAAYVEPSRRPSDGRYGENPNRLQLFHQFQVIMKPSPPDIKQLYLDSLRALGLDLSCHDIRFVHDDWESPTLGAWGLGWEVWIDGMEITQFTYFQAIGSVPLNPITAEIAYGLERLAMYIQNVENIFDVKWNDTLTFGDISKQSEWEWSTYNFEEASSEMWLRHFDDYEKEATSLISKHLPIPAYDFVLKASHAFNILDARGVISVTERTGYIARIRDLARLIAIGYLKSREEKGFPLFVQKLEIERKPEKIVSFPSPFCPSKKRNFLLEIGSEELPATFIPIGMKELERSFTQLLTQANLPFEKISTYGTPQRLAIYITGLAEGSKEMTEEKKGPPLSTAFDSNGNPTPQGTGFFKSLGCKVLPTKDTLAETGFVVNKIKEVDYLFYTSHTPSTSTAELFKEALPKLILGLDFPKKMRWGETKLSYARPIHWIVALFDKEKIFFSLEEIFSGSKTKGHAQLKPGWIDLLSAEEYLPTLKKYFVLADPKERKENLLKQLDQAESLSQGKIISLDKVLSQVLYLTEWPQVMIGSFKKEFLSIPSEVLISEMVEHQKYFPLQDATLGTLQNRFLITADNTPCPMILKGNEKVLSARLSDGVFLYEQDLKTPLASFNEKLKVMTFQRDLGSMYDKILRIENHAKILQDELDIADPLLLTRAALLCKADLATTLVAEFPELQGTIGKYYALAQKEQKEIALAIEEHWMPTSESSPLPKTPCGLLLSLADKIDNLLGYFSVGLKPSSSSDPYALRRQTFGLLKILIEGKYSIDLKNLLELCSISFPKITKKDLLLEEILHFISNRTKSLFEEYGYKKDEIEASLQGTCFDPFLQFCKVKALHTFRKTKEFSGFYEVYKRVKGFLDPKTQSSLDQSLLSHPSEKELLTVFLSTKEKVNTSLNTLDFLEAFQHLSALQAPLSSFLEQVKIMDEDLAVRASRTALIYQVFNLFEELLDFSKIQEL